MEKTEKRPKNTRRVLQGARCRRYDHPSKTNRRRTEERSPGKKRAETRWEPIYCGGSKRHSFYQGGACATRGLTMGFRNIKRGFWTKEEEVRLIIDTHSLDILLLSETDFVPPQSTKTIKYAGCDVIFPLGREKIRTVFLVKTETAHKIVLRNDLKTIDSTSIWLEFREPGMKRLLIGGFYREWRNRQCDLSRENQLQRLNAFCEEITRASSKNTNVIVGGDMNVDYLRREDQTHSLRYLWEHLYQTLLGCSLRVIDSGYSFSKNEPNGGLHL